MITKVIQFDVYENGLIKATATFEDGVQVKLKLKGKIPRGYYYSVLNDAGKQAELLYNNE